MTIPLTRSLPAVLRDALGEEPALHLLIGECGTAIAAPTGNAYVNVVINGVTVRVPRLSGSQFFPGAPAYLLAVGDALLYLGPVSTATPT
jgi:hypothetical protein